MKIGSNKTFEECAEGILAFLEEDAFQASSGLMMYDFNAPDSAFDLDADPYYKKMTTRGVAKNTFVAFPSNPYTSALKFQDAGGGSVSNIVHAYHAMKNTAKYIETGDFVESEPVIEEPDYWNIIRHANTYFSSEGTTAMLFTSQMSESLYWHRASSLMGASFLPRASRIRSIRRFVFFCCSCMCAWVLLLVLMQGPHQEACHA